MDSRALLARLIVIATISATVGSNLQIASYIARRAWQFIRFLYRAPWWAGYVLAGLLGALSLGPAAYLVIAGPPRPDSAGALYFTTDTCLLARTYGHLVPHAHDRARKAMDKRMHRPRRVAGR
jgi:hypothetical protein